MLVRTIQRLNYGDYNSDTSVTSRQKQGNQTWYALVDLKQGFNYALFEKSRSNSVREKTNDKLFFGQIRKHVNYTP